ncbi:MAG: hypothetical protein V7666_01765 [Sulfitobacter sp.]|uniref:hypothetical protein n=1 Tax=Sulfitobacter sp. TaxID=1903071 RepID=UPI0030023D1A
MNQIVNMIMRRFMGRLINKGINIGFDQASKLGKGRKDVEGRDSDAVPPSPAENARRNKAGSQQGKQARKMVRNMRKLTRF